MIVRIVIMCFDEGSSDSFLSLFKKHESDIRHFEGCHHLQLMRVAKTPACYATLSHWESLPALQAYRNSALFKSVWEVVSPLFSKPPNAFSLKPLE